MLGRLQIARPTMKSTRLLLCAIPLVESFSTSSIGLQPRHVPSRSSFRQHRRVHLPPRNSSTAVYQSVTGPIYEVDGDFPAVKLFTKEGCTLCDKVKDVLDSVREDHPHSLYAVDITDDDKQDWFAKYKYDIPVLHINDVYWTKHRLSTEDAIAGIGEARTGDFAKRQGEPDASRLEHS